MSKTCGECKWFVKNDTDNGCQAIGVESNFTACQNFDPIYKPTNGDKIRSMTDEQLAELLTNPPCFICSKGDAGGECTDTWANKNCKEAILAKLKTEAKDE